jgi:hypothetical protein
MAKGYMKEEMKSLHDNTTWERKKGFKEKGGVLNKT